MILGGGAGLGPAFRWQEGVRLIIPPPEVPVNTRTIAILALVIAAVVLLLLLT